MAQYTGMAGTLHSSFRIRSQRARFLSTQNISPFVFCTAKWPALSYPNITLLWGVFPTWGKKGCGFLWLFLDVCVAHRHSRSAHALAPQSSIGSCLGTKGSVQRALVELRINVMLFRMQPSPDRDPCVPLAGFLLLYALCLPSSVDVEGLKLFS